MLYVCFPNSIFLMNILIYSNIEEFKNVKAKEITIDRKNSSIVYFLFFFFLPSRNFIISNLIMNRSHYHLTRWIHLCQPWILNRRIVHIVRLNCEKCFSYGNPQLYHAIPTTEKHVPLMFIHALLSSTPHCRRASRSHDVSHARNLYLVRVCIVGDVVAPYCCANVTAIIEFIQTKAN